MSQLYLKNRRPGEAFYSAAGGEYNFPNDTTLGIVGNVGMGVWIPRFAVITRFNVTTITAPTSGGAATISFGIAGTTNLLMVATGVAGFIANQTLQGVDFNANPTMTGATDNVEVVMAIAAAALTGGRLKFDIEFAWYDL